MARNPPQNETSIKCIFGREHAIRMWHIKSCILIPNIFLIGRLLTRSGIKKLVKPPVEQENHSLVRWVGEWTLLNIAFYLMLLFVFKNVCSFNRCILFETHQRYKICNVNQFAFSTCRIKNAILFSLKSYLPLCFKILWWLNKFLNSLVINERYSRENLISILNIKRSAKTWAKHWRFPSQILYKSLY